LAPQRFDTQLIHAGEIEPRVLGAAVLPIFQTAMFEYAGEKTYDALRYIRLNNTPNHLVLHAKLAALEEAEAALVTASGMAAISTALLTVLKSGDHLLAQDSLYGGTHDLIHGDFAQLGIACDAIDPAKPETWAAHLKPTTRAIYVETISNPLMRVPDLKAVARFAKERGLVALVDNTFASPLCFKPAKLGFDLSLHSGTKYLNGHNDLVAGAVIGRRELVERVTKKLNHLGGSLDPHACFLLHRGIKTLGVRMRFQCESAMKLARFLSSHSKVESVSYPGLESHPQHALAKQALAGFGGMLAFEVKGGVEAAARFLERTRLPAKAPSLGGVESLLTIPAKTSHVGLAPEERRRIGVTDSLIRMSVGIEDPQDLLEDLDQALLS
jgi:cystathionine beta-lyase/cystathionine gamma-synthase